MSHESNEVVSAARLQNLAEFRYQLRKFLSFSEMASDRAGIPAQQYQLMQVIASVPEDRQPSISYLADRMILRHNSTVELVDRAERAGLVQRQTDPGDLRRSLIRLTSQGTGILQRLVKEHLEELVPSCGPLIQALTELEASERRRLNDQSPNAADSA